MRRCRIVGVGSSLPERVVTNADLERRVDTTDRWIRERTGIRARHIAVDGQVTSDLAAEAARQACRRAGVAPSDLDAILVATVTPDMPMPATAAFVQQKIGAGLCPAMDLSAACAGFLFGLGVADGLLVSGRFRKVLLVGVELLSRVLDWDDRNTCVLFGDGAGAAVLVAEEGDRGLLSLAMHTDGRGTMDLAIPGGGSRHPTDQRSVAENLHVVRMDGRKIFARAVRNMSSAARTVLGDAGIAADQVDIVVPHQANLRILEQVSRRTGIPMERFFINIDKVGNISSASIPVALADAEDAGQLRAGQTVLLTALGAGVSWAAALLRW